MKFNNTFTIGKNVRMGKNVRIGDRTTIYDNVVIGDGTTIANDCVIGEPLTDYYTDRLYKNPRTTIGPNSLIRSHTILYAGSSFGEGFQTGHRVTIREKTKIGRHCSIGTLSDIQGYMTMGDYCRVHSNAHICQATRIGSNVYIYPYVVFTNDPTPPSNICIGTTVKDYAVISTGSIIMPGLRIGTNALIAAGAVVTKNVDDFALVLGVPGKTVSDVRTIPSREHPGVKHYPWMHNFSRGKPWAQIGFKKWEKKQQRKK